MQLLSKQMRVKFISGPGGRSVRRGCGVQFWIGCRSDRVQFVRPRPLASSPSQMAPNDVLQRTRNSEPWNILSKLMAHGKTLNETLLELKYRNLSEELLKNLTQAFENEHAQRVPSIGSGPENNETWITYHNLTQSHPFDFNCYSLDGIIEFTHFYYLPCMIMVGLIGNLLSCIVFLNTHLKMRSSSYYLAALACADLGFLATLLIVWLSSNLDVPIFNVNGFCQCIVYLSSVCGFLSVWLIVAFTIERFIAVQYPLHRPHMCTVARAKAIVAYLVGFAALSHSYVFVTSGIIEVADGEPVCEMLESHHDTMRVINIIDSLLTLIIPLVLIVAMNVMIAVNLFRFSQRFKRHDIDSSFREMSDINLQVMPPASRSSSNNNNSRRNPSQQSFHSTRSNSFCQVQQSSHTRSRGCEISNVRCTQVGGSKCLISTKTQYSITKMLLLVSSVFLLLNLPSYVIRLYVFVFISIWSETPPARLWCVQQMFMSLYYTNFSVNFLLYSMYGITFRRCLSQLIRNKVKWISQYSCRERL